MAFIYRVFERKNTVPNAKTPMIAGATLKQIRSISTKELAADISDRCTVHRADVIAVLDALSISVAYFLTNGFGVKLGELGSLSSSVSYNTAATKKEFKPELLKKARVRFTPSMEIKEKMANGTFINIDDFYSSQQAKGATPSDPKIETEEKDSSNVADSDSDTGRNEMVL